MPPQRTQKQARSAPGQLHRAPYRRSRSPQPQVTTITLIVPMSPTSGSPSSSPFLLGEAGETASPRPISPLQRRRHGSEPSLGVLPVPLKKVSRGSIEKTTKKSSRQSGPNATSSQRKSTKKSRATHSRRPTDAEAVRLLDEAGSARPERLVRSGQRRSGVRSQGQPMTHPGVRGMVRRRAVTTNTGAPVAVLNGQQLGVEGRVAPIGGEPVPALRQLGPRDHLLTMTEPTAEERYLQGVLQLRRRVEETFVPEGQQARAPAPPVPSRRVGLSEIPMNVLNNGPVVVGGGEVRQGVVTNHRQPRQRPGARTYQDYLRDAFGFR